MLIALWLVDMVNGIYLGRRRIHISLWGSIWDSIPRPPLTPVPAFAVNQIDQNPPPVGRRAQALKYSSAQEVFPFFIDPTHLFPSDNDSSASAAVVEEVQE